MSNKIASGSQLQGVITALITPFSRDRVDVHKYAELVERACEAGLTGVVPLGTTGESPSLTDEERMVAVRCAIRAAKGRLKVIVGAGTNNTSKTVENVSKASDLGADAVLVVAPYYNKPTPEGLKRHFLTVADEAEIPIVLYHIPGRCGVGIPLELVLELAKHPRVIAIKEAGGDVWRSGEIARRTPDDFVVLSGDDPLTLPMMSLGAVGVISVVSNIAPRVTKDMVDQALAGDFTGALNTLRRLTPLLNVLFLETNPGPIKEAMNLVGMKVGQVRLPLARSGSQTRKKIRQALVETGKIT